MNELALFAGAGGGILGGKLLGWRTICAVEIDPYARRVLLARQLDGCLGPFPIWDDIRSFDGRPWCGVADVISGGFPCQDISAAGKGAGISGARSGLWGEMARIICEVAPRHVIVENSPVLTSRGLGRVLSDLATLGYDARWGVLGAVHAGAPHKRDRIWIVADSCRGRCGEQDGWEVQQQRRAEAIGSGKDVADSKELQRDGGNNYTPISLGQQSIPESRNDSGETDVAHADGTGRQEQRSAESDGAEHEAVERGGWWLTEPDVGRVVNGLASRVDRLRCIGNGQVPAVAALAWRTLTS